YDIGRKQLLGPKALYPLNMYVFWMALPATLLRFMSHADLGQIFGPNLAVVAISSLLTGVTSFALFYWIAKLVNPVSRLDRKSTRLNSSHVSISYAVFCLQKKTRTSL